jgi:cell division protease FtsH
MALGLTQSLPEEDRYMYSEEYCEINLSYLLGGRAAEMLMFDSSTSGAGNDIDKATDLARKMVCDWGMSEKLGTINYGQKDENVFLGREIAQHRGYSEQTARLIDEEVRRIVDEAYDRSFKLLKKNKELLERVGEELLERETLAKDELEALRAGKKLPPLKTAPVDKPKDEPVGKAATERGGEELDDLGEPAPQVS